MENPFRQGMRRKRTPQPCVLVIFGVGDLTQRKLLPALYRLVHEREVPPNFSIIAVGRRNWTDDDFKQFALDSLKASKETGDWDETTWQAFKEGLYFSGGAFDDPATYQNLKAKLSRVEQQRDSGGNVVFYLATPPSVFEVISHNLGECGLNVESNYFRRLVIEKPFGVDIPSAKHLNDHIHADWNEQQIYRIDHYLGKETVQNLMAIRFGNIIFEPLWNRNYVDHIQITAAEDLGMEGRGKYYEEAGIVRDMLQNHLLQLFTLVAMEPPTVFEAEGIRDEKVKVLKAVKPTPKEKIPEIAVRGQYSAGSLYGENLKPYREEEGVSPESITPTYLALKLEVQNWRWDGVPFYLRTGKRLPKKVTEIAVIFKHPPTQIFAGHIENNVLTFRIQPNEGISLRFASKTPGQDNALRDVVMDFKYDAFGKMTTTAYGRLLLDAMLGDATLFPREDEVERAWQLVQGILDAWTEGQPETYSAGTWGPDQADALLGRGRYWRRL